MPSRSLSQRLQDKLRRDEESVARMAKVVEETKRELMRAKQLEEKIRRQQAASRKAARPD